MLKYVQGDLFSHDFSNPTIIAHVTNNQYAWGSGFVIPLGKRFPQAREKYLKYKSWLGATQFVNITEDPAVMVANMCAQTLEYGRPLYYNKLANCMERVAECAAIYKQTVICPLFGAGLAGGNWDFIHELIIDCWIRDDKLDVKVYWMPDMLPKNIEKNTFTYYGKYEDFVDPPVYSKPNLKDVHTSHCCAKHNRCKYGKEDVCTVCQGIAPPEYDCNCEW